MGCDIHMVLEKNFQGKWVGLHAYPYLSKSAVRLYGEKYKVEDKLHIGGVVATSRNYRLFAALASVRGESPFGHEPLGLPADVSELAGLMSDEYGVDGHSHSYILLPEFLRCYAYAKGDAEAYNKGCVAAIAGEVLPFKEFVPEVLGMEWYGEEFEKATDYRIVFWFDN